MYWYRVTFIREDDRVLTIYIQTDAATDAIDQVMNGVPDYFAEADLKQAEVERMEAIGWRREYAR